MDVDGYMEIFGNVERWVTVVKNNFDKKGDKS